MIKGSSPIRVNKIGSTTIIGQARKPSFPPLPISASTSYFPPVAPWGVVVLAASEHVVSIAMQ